MEPEVTAIFAPDPEPDPQGWLALLYFPEMNNLANLPDQVSPVLPVYPGERCFSQNVIRTISKDLMKCRVYIKEGTVLLLKAYDLLTVFDQEFK